MLFRLLEMSFVEDVHLFDDVSEAFDSEYEATVFALTKLLWVMRTVFGIERCYLDSGSNFRGQDLTKVGCKCEL
jgi:hypothetical protein